MYLTTTKNKTANFYVLTDTSTSMLTVAFYTQKLVNQPGHFPLPFFQPWMCSSKSSIYMPSYKVQLLPKQRGKSVAFTVRFFITWSSFFDYFFFIIFISKQDFTVKKKKSQSTDRPLRNVNWGASKEESSATLSIMLLNEHPWKKLLRSQKHGSPKSAYPPEFKLLL